MPSITLPIRGSSFRPQPEINELIRACILNRQQVHLEAEYDNPYNSNAVRIMLGEHHLGYIPKEHALEVRNQLNQFLIESCFLIPKWSIEINLREPSEDAEEQQMIADYDAEQQRQPI